MYEPPDLTGAVLNQKHTLRRRIGWGGMGTVYATSTFVEGRRMAVKLLNEGASTEVVKRFIEEGRMCMRLDHPNILRVREVEVAEDGAPYLVMDFLSGVPLAAYTAQGGKVPLAQAVNILQGVLAALSYAHAQGVVHRDLKPDNVYLARDDDGSYTVKLLDFGIAKVMDHAGGMGKQTRTGALLGTPSYMSPEQIRSAKDVDARSDLFAVGVLAYEMLTGLPAFPAPTEFAKLAAVLGSEPAPLGQVDPALEALQPVVHRALAKDRNLRFQSAHEMTAALQAAYGGSLFSGPLSRLPEVPAHLNSITPQSISSSGEFVVAGTVTMQAVPAPASQAAALQLPSPHPGALALQQTARSPAFAQALTTPIEIAPPPPPPPAPVMSLAVAAPPQALVRPPGLTGTLPSHDSPIQRAAHEASQAQGRRARWVWPLGALLLIVLGVALGLIAARFGS